MKSYTKQERRLAINKAYKLFFSPYRFLTNRPLPYYVKDFDFRTRIDNLAYSIFKDLNKKVSSAEIKNKQRLRRERKSIKSFINVFERPLIKDYISNKNSLTTITDEKLIFGNRNHWAKNRKDRKILKVLTNN